MNSKKVNWMFLSIILFHLAVVLGLAFFWRGIAIGIVANLILSELILLIPALLFLVLTKTKLREILIFRKIKITSVLMLVLFVYLSMPLVTTVNAFSMLFAENAVARISGDIIGVPFIVMLLLMGVYGPVCEEVVFRGIMYTGYKKNISAFRAMLLSSLLFGLMHMNFNQALYAFVIGFILVLLKEATGSMWAPIIYHVVFNSHTVILLFLYEKLSNMGIGAFDVAQEAVGKQELISVMSTGMVVAAVSTALAGCVLVWIADNEGRKNKISEVFKRKKEKTGTAITLPLILSVVLCLAFMIIEVL